MDAPHVAIGCINLVIKVVDENGSVIETNCADSQRIFSEISITGKTKDECLNNVKKLLEEINKNEFVKLGMF